MKNPIEVVVLLQWKNEAAVEDVMKLMGARPAPRATGKPERLASELKARAAYLRSRPMSWDAGLQKQEATLLGELDALEIRARLLEVERKLGKTGPEYRADLARVEELAFAVRQSFASLVQVVDGAWPTRAKQEDPRRRAVELAQIEEFLAAKKARAQSTGTEGK
jgi:hypothetical protein